MAAAGDARDPPKADGGGRLLAKLERPSDEGLSAPLTRTRKKSGRCHEEPVSRRSDGRRALGGYIIVRQHWVDHRRPGYRAALANRAGCGCQTPTAGAAGSPARHASWAG